MAMKKLFSFQINDPQPMSISFACVADSLDEATEKTRAAGYRNFLLMEARELSGVETTSFARRAFSENPMLGPEWRPLVEAFVDSFQQIQPGEFWTVNWLNDGLGPDDEGSLYLQALAESDGGLLTEVGPSSVVQEKIGNQDELLHFLGWETPPGDPRLPNYLRWFEPGWNMWHVASVALQTMVIFLGITPRTKFVVHGYDRGKFDPHNKLARHQAELDGVVYAVAYSLPAAPKAGNADPSTATRGKKQSLSERLRSRGSSPRTSERKRPVALSASQQRFFNTELLTNHQSEFTDWLEYVPEWGEQYAFGWAAVNAFQSLADPSGAYTFPAPMKGDLVESERRFDAHAYFSALIALTSFRLGWTKPSWGLARLSQYSEVSRDPTLMFIRQHFPPQSRLALASFFEKAFEIHLEGQKTVGSDQDVPEEVKKYLARVGSWQGNSYTREIEDLLSGPGGNDPLHLSMHITNKWGGRWASRDDLAWKETESGLFNISLPTAEAWYGSLQHFAHIMRAYDVETLAVDLTVEPIGFMGRYRYSNHTGLWFACSRELHLLGNPS